MGDSLSRCFMLGCFGMALLLLGIEGNGTGETISGKGDRSIAFSQSPQRTRQMPRQEIVGKNRLVVDLGDRRVYFYDDKKLTASYPVSIGQSGWETPTGSFKITRMEENPVWQQPITGAIVPPGGQNPLGDRWIGFWTDGSSYIGFHGTPDETKVGLAISHGCLRMRNSDIRQLYNLVTIGTPVKVQK
ncbi:MAG: L,D-transpeptidase [Geitlerinemataceae cyanobacterium]